MEAASFHASIPVFRLPFSGRPFWPSSRGRLSWGWWSRLWPAEDRMQYERRHGPLAGPWRSKSCLLIVFAPIVGIPAFMWLILLQVWSVVTAPLRAIKWLKARLSPRAT